MPPILDVAIGTIFVFLLFSLVLSALSEVILSFFDQRAKFLQMGLKELLGDDQRVKELCEHGLINAFSRTDNGNRPSYIPAGAFVTALLDLLIRKWPATAGHEAGAIALAADIGGPAKGKDQTKTPPAAPDLSKGPIPDELRNRIANLPDGDRLGQSLRSLLLMTGGQDVVAFKTVVEGWFNDTMDRVSGWYKRFSQTCMISIGILLAAAVNVDSIHIIQTLSKSPNLAKAVAAQAESYAKNAPPMTDEQKKEAQYAKSKAVTDAQDALNEAQKLNDKARADAAQQKLDNAKKAAQGKSQDQALTDFNKAIEKLGSTGIPIGWDQAQTSYFMADDLRDTDANGDEADAGWWAHFWRGFMVVCGWLVTALAASLGAPFWFDILSRFINIRSAGKAPNEKDPTASAKIPSPTSLNATPGTTTG
jgi:hypothetical protein